MANLCKYFLFLLNCPIGVVGVSSIDPLKLSLLHSDMWAIGVITYFLLCGYTPFDRDSNLEEMQAILVGDFSFKPEEYWHNVSKTARDFVSRCLTVDPKRRMTAQEALNHRWIADMQSGAGEDLLPVIKKNFNARRTLHAAIDTIRAINQLRGVAGTPMVLEKLKKQQEQTQNGDGGGHGDDGSVAENGQRQQRPRYQNQRMDSRSNARGQTEEMIIEQQRRIMETQQKIWRR